MSGEESVEVRAKEMGWSPKEEFRGDPERWIDAESFVKRGEELMPILQANNRKLMGEVSTLKGKLNKNEELLKAATESIETLKEFTNKATIKDAKAKKTELAAAIKDAREEGNVEAELELTEQLTETSNAIKEAEKPAPKKEVEQPSLDDNPDWQEWTKENTWFSDRKRAAVAIEIASELRADPANKGLSGKAFLQKVTEGVEEFFGQKPNGASKVEGGRPSGNGGSNGGKEKAFSDLPADAKQACDHLAGRLVGPGRAYKTLAEWRAAYTIKYNEEE